jgi:hypothetical protein
MNTNDIAKACNRYILILDILNDKNNMKIAMFLDYKLTDIHSKRFLCQPYHMITLNM